MSWILPNPPVVQDRLHSSGDNLREHLEDVEMELLALAWRTAAEMNVVNPAAGEGWPSAQRDLERVLSTQGCKFIHIPILQEAIPVPTASALLACCHGMRPRDTGRSLFCPLL